MKTSPDGALATAQGIIADLQRQLADRTAERDEAVAQQTATAEVLQVINSSPGDLAPVFEAILDKAHALCDATRGALFLDDGGKFKAAVVHGYPEDVAEHLRAGVDASHPHYAPLFAGERVHFPDLTQVANAQTGRLVSGRGGVRTNLLIPLLKDNALLGWISCNRTEVRPFSDKEIALIENFAAQAVIAIENARLITETREALDQQTATAEVLQVINSAPGDLAPVFDAMLEKALHLCEAKSGLLNWWDGECLQRAAWRGFPAELTEAPAWAAPFKPPSGSFADRLLRGENVISVSDLSNGEASHGSPHVQSLARTEAARSYVMVALRKNDRFLGLIVIYRSEVRPFSDKQIALIQNFAAQAVIAMENARLITETREALEQQTATTEVLQVINSSPGDLAPVFDAMLDRATQLCGVEFGSLQLYDGEMFRAAANRGLPQDFADRLSQGYRPGPAHPFSALFRGDEFVQVPDLAQSDTPQGAFEFGGMRTVLSVPLRRQGSVIGIINLARNRVEPFTDKQIALLQNFAAQAVIAMENARLITETREALEQQTATAEVLQVINSSPGNLAPVFEVMLEKALSLCEAAQGTLRIYDGEKFALVAVKGEEALVEAVQRLGPIIPAHHNPYTPLVKGDTLVHIVDSRETPGYREIATTRERIDRGGIRTWLAVPLRKGDVLLGAFAVYRREVRQFDDKQIALLQNFAAQAVIAIENARLAP